MRKKKVSFFGWVRIPEIQALSLDQEWSDTDNNDDICATKFKYPMELDQDFGDYHEDLKRNQDKVKAESIPAKIKPTAVDIRIIFGD